MKGIKMDIQVERIISLRKSYHPDDPRIYDCWKALVEILVKDEDETIWYISNCDADRIEYISEVFDDISEKLQSIKFIECIEQVAIKYPDINMHYDILYAKKVIENK
jgi:hypothetical protein